MSKHSDKQDPQTESAGDNSPEAVKTASSGTAPKSKRDSLKGDERNLVDINEAFKEAEFEDRMWLLWNENKSSIILGIAVAFILVIGLQFLKWSRASSIEKMQAAYAAATDDAQKEAFASEYSEDFLGGVAWLELADKKFEAEDFSEAATLYERSAVALAGNTAQARALLGQGISLIQSDAIDAGKEALNKIVDQENCLDAYKSEAIYHLVTLAIQAKDYALARLYILKMEELDFSGYWGVQLRSLQQNYSQLNDDKQN